MFRDARFVFVYNTTKETFLAYRVSVADSVVSRLVGLLGRKSLQPDSGIWIVPANSIHSIGMLFSFDAVLIDEGFKVVGLKQRMRPFSILLPNARAESVVELPAHSISKSRTEIGDQLLIERHDGSTAPSLPTADPATRLTATDGLTSVIHRDRRHRSAFLN